jgi:hypothetical protein
LLPNPVSYNSHHILTHKISTAYDKEEIRRVLDAEEQAYLRKKDQKKKKKTNKKLDRPPPAYHEVFESPPVPWEATLRADLHALRQHTKRRQPEEEEDYKEPTTRRRGGTIGMCC